MKKKAAERAFAMGLVLLLGLATACQASPFQTSPLDESRRDYGAGATRKLGRGLANTGLGWMELFKGMQDVSHESGFWAGATWGPIYGTMNAVRRTAAGVYETATFPLGGPNRFEPILEPEYVLDK